MAAEPKHKMKLYPFDQVVRNANQKIDMGFIVYQQWNCQHCGAKQTMDEPDTFFELGICEECKKETNIKKNGMNFMATVGIEPKMVKP